MKKTPSSRSFSAGNGSSKPRDDSQEPRRFGDKKPADKRGSYQGQSRDGAKAAGRDFGRGSERGFGGENTRGGKAHTGKSFARDGAKRTSYRDEKAANPRQSREPFDEFAMDEPVPLSAAGFVWGDVYRVWREFCQPHEMPFSDRFLKQVFKSRYSRFDLQLAEQLKITKIFNQGVVFLELATYLQQSFEAGKALDVTEFDDQFVTRDAKSIPHQDYWYWIGLRTGTDVSDYIVRDRAARLAHFKDFAAFAEREPESPAGLLWFGLRPSFADKIAARAQASNWSSADTAAFIRGQAETLPLWLRPQTSAPLETLVQNLVADGVNARLVEGVISVDGGRGITQTALYKAGAIEIQDLSSQQIAQAVAAEPGQKVWDACAGAGGKALAIASRMANKGVVVATDAYEHKLQELKRRAKRAEVFNLRNFVWDATAPLRLPQEVAKQNGFDWILVDAPCTASGTWRRNMDARWRLSDFDTDDIIKLQRKILGQAVHSLRPGGHFVYATCSWLNAENEAQVEWLLGKFGSVELVSQTLLGAPATAADTMFVAVLRRRP